MKPETASELKTQTLKIGQEIRELETKIVNFQGNVKTMNANIQTMEKRLEDLKKRRDSITADLEIYNKEKPAA